MPENLAWVQGDTATPGIIRTLVGAAFVATAALFWPTLASYHDVWTADGFSHGYLIAGLTGWLVWRHRAELMGSGGARLMGPHAGTGAAVLLVLGFSLVWLVATVANLRAVHQAAVPAVLACWSVAVLGRGSLRVVLPIAATFLLAVPVWGVLVPVLRELTILMSGVILKVVRIPAHIEGDSITIQAGTFVVEHGCAGLNYLLGGLVIGAFYANLLMTGWRARLAVVSLIAAISIVGNWIRVTVLVVIGHVSGMESSLIEDHLWMGWAIFAVGLVPFFLLGEWIGRRDMASALAERAGAARADPPGGEGAEVFADRSRLARRAVMISALAVVGPVLYVGVGALPEAKASASDPGALAASYPWSPAEPADPRPFSWRPGFGGAQEQYATTFTDGSARVYLDRLVYRHQEQGGELIGYPNRIAPEGTVVDERLVGPLDAARKRWVRQVVVGAPEGLVLVWYWFRVGGIDTFSPTTAKLLEVRAFLTRSRTSELLALSAPCTPTDCTEAFEALSGFAEASFSRRGAS